MTEKKDFPTKAALRYFKAYSVICARGSGYDYPSPLPQYLWDKWTQENEECTDAWKAWQLAMNDAGKPDHLSAGLVPWDDCP